MTYIAYDVDSDEIVAILVAGFLIGMPIGVLSGIRGIAMGLVAVIVGVILFFVVVLDENDKKVDTNEDSNQNKVWIEIKKPTINSK